MSVPNTHDLKGRPWAKLSELKPLSIIELDDGFICHPKGHALVEAAEDGTLFFHCRGGTHDIAPQADDGEHCIGIYGPIKRQP